MRGNEESAGTTAVVRRQKFPIPMRGNEPEPAGRIRGLLKFPIPMRGNELWGYPDTDATLNAFPIPMRGNENEPTILNAMGRLEFPIPMRGNETPCLGPAGALRRGVSDPHEG